MITIREGSSLHYCLLWIDDASRHRFVSRLNLIQALATTLDDVQDPNVAQTKIHWWHEELERMVAGKARHPAVQPCQAQLSENTTVSPSTAGFETHPAVQACLAIISAASTTRFNTPENNGDADALLSQSYTARMALLSHALSHKIADLALESHPVTSALALGKHEQLLRLPQLIHRGQPVFSNELYRKYNIKPADLAAHIRVVSSVETPAEDSERVSSTASVPVDVHPKDQPGMSTSSQAASRLNARLGEIPIIQDNPNRTTMLTDVISHTHSAFNVALTDTTVAERYRHTPLLPLWRLLVLREKQLALWERKQPDLLRERSTLTPLHKLFWAWRNRR